MRLEMVRLGSEMKAVERAMAALDGQVMPSVVPSLAAPQKAERQVRRGPGRPKERSKPSEAPKRKPGRPRKVRDEVAEITAKAALLKPPKRKPGRPRKVKPPKPEDLKPLTADMPGVTVTKPGASVVPGQGVVPGKAVIYRFCPNCKKRTTTNPCHVCGDKMVVVKNLTMQAPVVTDTPSPEEEMADA
ncbi:MAG: hypothetical protein PHS14_18100 [Elusimicrobia bacterium]|nr:hypothetical protein [Elusimicrobiota bacterium]